LPDFRMSVIMPDPMSNGPQYQEIESLNSL